MGKRTKKKNRANMCNQNKAFPPFRTLYLPPISKISELKLSQRGSTSSKILWLLKSSERGESLKILENAKEKWVWAFASKKIQESWHRVTFQAFTNINPFIPSPPIPDQNVLNPSTATILGPQCSTKIISFFQSKSEPWGSI